MRLGVYGGTFNPIHNGHIHVMSEFYNRLGLDKLLLVPTAQPPHKEAHELASERDRLFMCELAAKSTGLGGVEVSDIEMKRSGKSYTFKTLQELAEIYKSAEFFLLMGEDMFLTVDKWKNPEVIFELATLCASPRSESMERLTAFGEELAEKYGAVSVIEDISFLDVSSTDIRERRKKNESVSGFVPKNIEEYIIKQKLYEGGLENA